MIAGLFTWVLSKFGGSLLDKVLDGFVRSEDAQIRAKGIDAETTREALKAYVESQRVQADLQKAKFQFPWYWLMIASFIVPLSMWWCAVILDSIFHLDWKIANLPTVELREWASQMIAFLFYSGGTVLGIKALLK